MDGSHASKRVRSRFTADSTTRIVLTERDIAVLRELFVCRLLTRDHLIKLGYFPSVGRANQSLRRLFDHGFVRRIFPELGPFGSQAIYSIGPAAKTLIAGLLGQEEADVVKVTQKTPGRLHIEHTVKVHDVRLLLLATAARVNWQVVWTPEVLARHEYAVLEGNRWVNRILKPDAFASISAGAGSCALLVEVDLGHVAREQWRRTLYHYDQHAKLGLVEAAYHVPAALVLTVTTGGMLRLTHLMEPVPRRSERFVFTTFEALNRDGFEAPVFLAGTDSTPRRLAPFGGFDATL